MSENSFSSANFALISEKWLWPLEYPFNNDLSFVLSTGYLNSSLNFTLSANFFFHNETNVYLSLKIFNKYVVK